MPPPAEGFATRFVLGPALRTQPDRRLVALVREGYETAFEEIVRRYGKLLTRYAAAIVGSRGEDVTQDAFSKALLALRRDDVEIELRPWLFRIVRNTALNELRDRPPSPEVLAEAIAGGSNPAEEMERREELADLMRRLQSLPEPQRAAIVMRELEGLSHEEIAAALGLSGGAARQAIYRARQALRDGLGFLLPLPLVRLLIDHGSEAAIAGVSAGSATAAAGGAVGGAGASMALKAGVVTVVLAGSVGTGIALQENRGHRDADATAAAATEQPNSQAATPLSTVSREATSSDDSGGGEDRGDDGGSGHGGDDSNSGPDSDSGHGGVIEPSQSVASDDSGPGPSSKSGHGHGPGDSGDDRHGGRGGPGPSDGDDHSGRNPGEDSHSSDGSGGRRSGSGGGGDDGGGSSGPGSGGSGGDLAIEQPPPPISAEGAPEEEDHSGSGSGSGSSSGSGSGSSGSGDDRGGGGGTP